jgi:hypothetical protein
MSRDICQLCREITHCTCHRVWLTFIGYGRVWVQFQLVILLTSLVAMTAFALGYRHSGLKVGPCGSSRPGGRAPRSRPARRSSGRR